MAIQLDPHQLWPKFRIYAVSQVRKGFGPPYHKKRRPTNLFGILRDDSFYDVVGWQVYELTDGEEPPSYIAQRTCWKQDQDSRRVHDPIESLEILRLTAGQEIQPVLESASVVPDAARIVAARDRILALWLPLRVERNNIGLDGASYELIQGDYMARSTLRWWGDAPVEWRDAGEIVMEMLEYLELLYEKSR
jgi:hypothetical protein